MSELDEERELKPLLATFRCCQDEEIEQFLHGRAVEFEKLSKSRTYLVCDEEELQSKNINQLTIYGYISLALKILTVPPNVSNRIRKEIDGFSSKLHGEQIISFAEDVISTAVEAVGGRYMMIECRDEEKLIKFYSDNHFIEISRIPDRQQAMVQMIRKI
jgi:hypothetical protein